MGGAASNVLVFLIDTLFELYIIVVLLRLLLGLVQADFYNPVSQFIVALTNPVLRPLRRVLPPLGPVDTAAVILLLLLKFAQMWLLAALAGVQINPAALVPVVVVELLVLAIYIFIFSIIIQAVLSWFGQGAYSRNPAVEILHDLNEPLLRPIRSVVPLVGAVDLSPLVAIILLNVLLILIRSV